MKRPTLTTPHAASFKAVRTTTICLCIAEKEVFVVESVFDEMMAAMRRAGAIELNAAQIAKLTSKAIVKVGDDQHDAAAKELHWQRC